MKCSGGHSSFKTGRIRPAAPVDPGLDERCAPAAGRVVTAIEMVAFCLEPMCSWLSVVSRGFVRRKVLARGFRRGLTMHGGADLVPKELKLALHHFPQVLTEVLCQSKELGSFSQRVRLRQQHVEVPVA